MPPFGGSLAIGPRMSGDQSPRRIAAIRSDPRNDTSGSGVQTRRATPRRKRVMYQSSNPRMATVTGRATTVGSGRPITTGSRQLIQNIGEGCTRTLGTCASAAAQSAP